MASSPKKQVFCETNVCRLLLETRAGGGRWNMALDEALLEAAIKTGQGTLRFYRWSEPTISLGYFQDAAEVEREMPQVGGLATVRRLSGGGAILHHHEWTYSCTLPPSHPLAQRPEQLYHLVHESIVEVLRKKGVPAGIRGDASADPGEAAFLCFTRGDQRDVVLNGHKVVGSAQRRRRGAVVQHGSVLLHGSPFAPHLPGIGDLVPDWSGADSLPGELGSTIGNRLAGGLVAGELSSSIWQRARELEQGRYGFLDRLSFRRTGAAD